MTGDIRHASKWACLKKDVLRVIDPHELYEALIVVVDPPRSIVRHQETILHVDESRRTAVRSSAADGSVSLV